MSSIAIETVKTLLMAMRERKSQDPKGLDLFLDDEYLSPTPSEKIVYNIAWELCDKESDDTTLISKIKQQLTQSSPQLPKPPKRHRSSSKTSTKSSKSKHKTKQVTSKPESSNSTSAPVVLSSVNLEIQIHPKYAASRYFTPLSQFITSELLATPQPSLLETLVRKRTSKVIELGSIVNVLALNCIFFF